VDFLETLKVPYYKISSFENNHLPLIDKISKLKKPVLISTGMASKEDLVDILKIFKANKNNKLIFLKCVSSYPAESKDFNLNVLKKYQNEFNCLTGLSDHSLDSTAAIVSISLGARVFEKHLSLKNVKSLDSSFSVNESNFKFYVKSLHEAFESLGTTTYGAVKSEKASLQERRSIYVTKNVKKNDIITEENISIIRPAYGLAPKMKSIILKKKFTKNLKIGQRLKIEHIKNK
jgi:N-acetylneuraminate synthase